MTSFWIILVILFSIASIFTLTILISFYIHSNMKGTKIWKYVNKYIIANEDDYIK